MLLVKRGLLYVGQRGLAWVRAEEFSIERGILEARPALGEARRLWSRFPSIYWAQAELRSNLQIDDFVAWSCPLQAGTEAFGPHGPTYW